MIDTNEIRAYIARNQTSQEAVAKACGMSSKTFYNKMKKGVFGSDEIEKMIVFLNIKNPEQVFFCPKSNL